MMYAILGAGGLALAIWMLLVEPRRYHVREVVRPTTEAGLPPLRILHVTDTHFHGRHRRMLSFLRDVASRKGPFDLVVYTGDLIDRPAGLEALREAVRALPARLGSFAVLGGHDYRHYGWVSTYTYLLTGRRRAAAQRPNPWRSAVKMLEAEGVCVLSDEARMVKLPGGTQAAVVGLRDAFVCEPDYEAAWQGLNHAVPSIVLAHSPDVLPGLRARRVDLAFFGHTHGGQVRLPLVGAVVTRSALPREMAHGTFTQDGCTFVINCGLGVSAVTPYRLLARPEVVLFELTPGRPALEASDE